jgi:FtsP/CotA-like multicopper oxidase with cupredoxin domain
MERRIRPGNTALRWMGGMTSRRSARARTRRTRSAVLAALVVLSAALIGVLAPRLIIAHGQVGPSDPAPPAVRPAVADTAGRADRPRPVRRAPQGPPLGEPARVRNGRSTLDEATPAVANLDPALLRALRRAATAAGRDGVELRVTSGWRSPAHQRRLLRDAIARHGSAEEAARWVATPETSAHVSGDAVDIGPADGISWLSEHGSEHGLCQIYENEPWHYELRPEAADDGCPPMYANPTHDPRMQR